MNTIADLNYQTTFGMKQGLKQAEIIQRKAKNTYQHISPNILSDKIDKAYKLDMNPLYLNSEPYIQYIEKLKNIKVNRRLLSILRSLENKLFSIRNRIQTSQNPIKAMIENMKNGNRLGNSGEEIALAAAIGKINGQKNIYTGHINGLDHGVSFITNKPVQEGKKLFLKNKDAIIIDPQLGITDYAENYFAKIKDLVQTPYKKKTHRSITPLNNFRLNDAQIADLKANYPELIISNYKPVVL